MTAATAMQREAIRLTALIAVLATGLLRCGLRSPASNESRQRIDIARLALDARLRPLGRPCLLRLAVVTLLARLEVLIVARLERLRIGRNVGLRFSPAERSFDERLSVVAPLVLEILFLARLELLVIPATAFRTLRLEIRILLAELLLRGGDQAEIMFGVLVVILGRDPVARLEFCLGKATYGS